MSDDNNLLVKYGITVKGSTERVDVEFRKRSNQVALVFTGVHTAGAMEVASVALTKAIPSRLASNVTFGVTGGEFTVLMPVGTYEELTGQKFDRGRAQET
jgi:hypothetical protein